MEKYYVGEDSQKNETDSIWKKPTNLTSLKKTLTEMSLYIDIEERREKTILKVPDDVGTSLFLATAIRDHEWLKRNCDKIERKGKSTWYHFNFGK